MTCAESSETNNHAETVANASSPQPPKLNGEGLPLHNLKAYEEWKTMMRENEYPKTMFYFTQRINQVLNEMDYDLKHKGTKAETKRYYDLLRKIYEEMRAFSIAVGEKNE